MRKYFTQKLIVNRSKDTLFGYNAWPSVCCDENGTLYAVSSAFRMEHICPFGNMAMYISKDGGKTWTPPIVVCESYLATGGGGIVYLGNGRMLIHYDSHPGDVFYNEMYERICGTVFGGEMTPEGKLRAAMMDIYPHLPVEKLIGGAYVKVSEDYGVTWSDPIRIPVLAPHGPAVCKDGTLILLGKEYYACPDKTFEAFSGGETKRVKASSWSEYIDALANARIGKESQCTPICAYASTDGGYTWEKRGICEGPACIKPLFISEPHILELDDKTLLGVIRVEDEGAFENEMTIYSTKSSDGGRTWSAWKCTHICGVPAHLLKHSSGKIISAL